MHLRKQSISSAPDKTEYATYIGSRKQSTAITEKKTKYLAAACIYKTELFLETGEASRKILTSRRV
jgi:hypothetical protein